MKLFELIDISDKDEDSRRVGYILEFFQFFIHEERDKKCLFQLVYEYDPYGWTDPLFASGFSVLEYASLFYIYFKIRWSVINFSIFADSKFTYNLIDT